ncbi:hypothetical protein [Microbacterium sp. CH-015]|uniref:hypothetical protein n=1 Tax=Microbacterium sp. CH-015 TaxID=3406734 RepID=UPI003C72DA29
MTDSPELAARLAELEAENAQLRAASGVAAAPAARPSRGRWRAAVSALCIVIAAILVPVSIATAWR